MPFALLGVLLLLASMFGLSYLSHLQSQHLEERIREDVIQESFEIAALVHQEVETEAYLLGTRAVRMGAGNQSRISSLHEEMMESYLEGAFPRRIEDFHIEIRNHSTSLILVNGVLEDFGREVGVENDAFGNRTYEELETSRSGHWMRLERTMTFSVTGSVEYVMSARGIASRHVREFSKDLDSLVPFLMGRVESLASNVVSGLGDVSRITEYMLSTLVQMRVLQGWGSDVENAPPTSGILTPKDVERALNLALILESLILFRSTDRNAIGAFDSYNPRDESDTSLDDLMEDWGHSELLDPSDLFLLFTGGRQGNLSIGTIVSQAIYAMVDQMTLKYFDYFGLAPVVDLSLQVAQMLASSIQDFLFWISGEDKEAWLTRSWFKNLARDTGIGTLISYPLVFEVPGSELRMERESGDAVNFTIPGFSSYVPFEVRDLGDGFDDFWRSCYHLVYEVDAETVHRNHRELVKDLASRIGEVAERAANSVALSDAINPTDNVSALRDVSGIVKETASVLVIQLSSNESLIGEIISRLWEAQAGMVVNVFSEVESRIDSLIGDRAKTLAEEAIAEELLLEVKNLPEYENLTPEEKERLHEMVERSVVERGLGDQALAELTNRTLDELRAAGSRAASLNASSEEGGVHSRLRDFVGQSSGILREALRNVENLMDSTTETEDAENIPLLVSKTDDAFRFWDRADGSGTGRRREFRVNVSRSPAYLRANGWPAECNRERLDSELLCVDVESPLDARQGSGNVHYTDVTRSSFAPYITSWNIRVRAHFGFSAIVNHLSEMSLWHVDRIAESVPLEFEIHVSARSGWGLEGVAYESSDTFLEDIWETFCRFLDIVWDGLLKVFDWVLDGISWLVSLVRELCSTLLSYAREVMKAIYDVIELTTELLRSAISGVTGIIGGLIEEVVSAFGGTEIRMSVLGGELEIGLNRGNGTIVEGVFETSGLTVILLFKKLSDMNLTEDQKARVESDYDVLLSIHAEFRHLDLSGKFDPAMVLEGSFFRASARWADDWEIELEVPSVERFNERRYTLEMPSIPTPIGTLDVELGILLKLTGDLREVDLVRIFSSSFGAAWDMTLGKELSIDSAARFVDIGLSTAIARLVEAVEGNLHNISETVVYFEGQVRAVGSAGIGVRLALAMERDVLLEGFSWLSTKLGRLISTFGSPPSTSIERDLVHEIATGVFLGFEVLFSVGTPRLAKMLSGKQELGAEVLFVVSIRVNLAALAHLMGRSVGCWTVDFGIYLEWLPSGLIGGDGSYGDVVNLWLLRGSAHQV